MKKSFMLVALAGMVLASCVKDEVNIPQAKDVKIGFASPVLYSNVDTKANKYGEIGSHTYDGTTTVYSYPREENFKIFAVEHEGNLTSWTDAIPCEFNGTSISYNPSFDAWVPVKTGGGFYYWPDNELLSFAAVSPADLELTGVEATYAATGLKIENFAVNAVPAKQYDLLYSKRAVNQRASNMIDGADYYSGIPIEFQHALTSIHFSLKKDAAVTESVTLKKIELKKAKNTGTFSENITNETVYACAPEWTNLSGEADYVSFSGEVEFPVNPQYVSSLAAADGTEDSDESRPLLVMPQELADATVVEITYTVGSEEKKRTVQLNAFPAADPITEWEIGTRYTYRLYYSKASEIQDIIYFAPSTGEWANGGIIEVLL